MYIFPLFIIVIHVCQAITGHSRQGGYIYFVNRRIASTTGEKIDKFQLSHVEKCLKTLFFQLQPLWWEYIWLLSLIFAFLVIPGIRRNDIKKMQQVVIGITLLGFGPLIYAFIYYFQDVWRYLKTGEKTEIEIWQVSKIENMLSNRENIYPSI